MVKILGWNVNGLRSFKTNMKNFLDELNAEIICFQETKITRDMLTEDLAIIDGYHSFFNFSQKRSGYSGVVTYCKKVSTPLSVELKLSQFISNCLCFDAPDWTVEDLKDLDSEGRAVITQHVIKKSDGKEERLYVINVYCPRADPERPERLTFKLDFYKLLRQASYVMKKAGAHVIIIGDINTSHRRIDHCDPDESEEFEKRSDRQFLDCFLMNPKKNDDQESQNTPETPELSLRDAALEDFQVVDTFRFYHNHQKDAFTCWNTKANARATNYGTRIDYILCDKEFLEVSCDSLLHPDVMGSDHCPVSIELNDDIQFIASSKVPRECSRHFPEFQGQQQKLLTYFGSNSTSKLSEDQFLNGDSIKRKVNSSDTLADYNKSSREKSIKKQRKVSSYFNIVAKETSEHISAAADATPTTSFEENNCGLSSTSGAPKTDKSGWGFLMKGPKPPPLCIGHKEPSVLRTVKKKGSNFNRQFYACSRGAGREGDPNAQCNFFKWFM